MVAISSDRYGDPGFHLCVLKYLTGPDLKRITMNICDGWKRDIEY